MTHNLIGCFAWKFDYTSKSHQKCGGIFRKEKNCNYSRRECFYTFLAMAIFFRPRKDSKTPIVAVVNETLEAKSQSAFERPEMKVSGFFDNDCQLKHLNF